MGSAWREGERRASQARFFDRRTSTTWAPPEPSSLQPEAQPCAQSDGMAKEGRSIDCPSPPAHCHRTPRSPANGPIGAGSAGRRPRRQCTPSVRTWRTSQATSATSIFNADASAPNPVPRTVRSVPPASEPVVGSMEVMRGGISASNGSPGRTNRIARQSSGRVRRASVLACR